jgi:hypothetical protein
LLSDVLQKLLDIHEPPSPLCLQYEAVGKVFNYY